MFSTLLAFCTAPNSGRDEAGNRYNRPLQERLGTDLSVSCGYSECFLGRQLTRLLV